MPKTLTKQELLNLQMLGKVGHGTSLACSTVFTVQALLSAIEEKKRLLSSLLSAN